jgi:hypothetical protein
VFKTMTRSQNLKRVIADTNRVHTSLKPWVIQQYHDTWGLRLQGIKKRH